MTVVDRFTDACLARAARRWPDDVSVELVREWHAELSALRADRSLTRLVRAARSVAFAASLALSPPVEPAGAAPRTWRDRAIMAGRPLLAPAGVTLAAGALFNLVHLVSRSVPVPARTPVELGALAVAVAAMARLGLVGAGWSAPRRPVAATVLTGLALYGFLLAGNPDPVMPFMGWRDIGPGVAAWTALTGTAVGVSVRLRGSGRPRAGRLTGIVGAVAALEVATVCGALHAAGVLGFGARSAATWFPLTLLPGSGVLLGNTAAMVGPMLLCSACLVAYAVGIPRPVRWLPVGLGAAVVFASGHPSHAGVTTTLARLADNSETFGFGFAAPVLGRALIAIAVGAAVLGFLTRAAESDPM